MSKFIHSDNLKNYYNEIINDEFLSLSKEDMIKKLSDGLEELDSTPPDIRRIYTSRDAHEIRRYLISMIHDLTNDWTDFNESDIGVTLIELIAGVADMLGFYLDRQTLECYITSVKQRKNGAAILKLIGYNLHMARSSTTTGRFTFPQNYNQEIKIPKYTQVSATMSDKTKIYYATTEDATLLPGSTELDVPLIQGEVHRSNLKIKDLRSNQKVNISTQDVAEGTVSVVIGGLEWTEVPDVLVDDIPGPKFSVHEDKNCQAYIYFHNTYLDYLPSNDDLSADISFLVTLGRNGHISDGIISKVESPIYYDSLDISNKIEVTNLGASSGGADRETLDEARVQAPKSLSMLGRAIVLQDFEDMATEIQGVLKCKALDWSIDGNYVTEPYAIDLYVLPSDGYELSASQTSQILEYFKGKTVSYQVVRPKEPHYIYMDLDISVDAYVSESNLSYLKSKIISTLQSELSPSNLEFGMTILISDIKSIIRSVSDSIVLVDIPNLEDNIYLKLNEFLRLGNIRLGINAKNAVR